MSHMPQNVAQIVFNAKNYGALGNNVSDDAAAIQDALDDAALTTNGVYGAIVYLPKGLYRVGSQIQIPNGVGLIGAGPATSIIKALNTFNAQSMIRNSNQDGGQEYAFLESITVDANKGGGAVCSVAAVDFVGLFINSYIRDAIILSSSNVGLRIAARLTGMGPIYVENTWVIHSNGHNVLVEEEATNAGACKGLCFVNLTSEHQATGKSAIYLKGLGQCLQWNFFNTHIEMVNGGVGTRGITFDGVGHTTFTGLQLQCGSIANVKGIEILNVAQNVGLQFRGVTNINNINPVLDDLKNGITVAGVNLPRYCTPDVHFIGPQVFEAKAAIQTAVGTAIGGTNPNLDLEDTTSHAAGVGGSVRFMGAFNGVARTSAAEIKASKTNGTAGDFGFELKFATRVNGGSLVEAMRILSDFRSVAFFGQTRTTNEVVPAQITANQNDYSPAGMSDASVLLLNSDAARDVTGFATGASGRWLWVYNTGAFNITLKHLVTSSANNQIRGRGAADTVLTPSTGVQLYYSPSLAKWVVMTDTL